MIAEFLADQLGKVIRSGGETTADYPGLSQARKDICKGCPHMQKVGIKNTFGLLTVDGCGLCKCPLISKTKTLFHRDYSNKIDWKIENLIEVLDKDNVPFVITMCDLGKWEEVDHKYLGVKKIISLVMGIVDSIKDFGVKRANPLACPTNFARLEKCVKCHDVPTCEDQIVIPEAEGKTIASLNLDGVEYSDYAYDANGNRKAITASADNEDAVCDSLHGLIRLHETKVFVDAKLKDGSLTIRHIGQCRLKSVTLFDGTVIEATKLCKCVKIYTYQVKGPVGATPNLTINDSEGNELLNKALTGDYTEVNETTAAALQTELTDCYADTTFTVTANTVLGYFEVRIDSESEIEVYLAKKCAELCDCVEKFVAEEESK